MADEEHEFPRWEEFYESMPLEKMPWYNPDLDDDLATALNELGIEGGTALDLGSGPGTQAVQLARRGFDVTATDISEAAVRMAREKAEEQGVEVAWEQDDILDSRLDQRFDLIFDRGCFHVLPPARRQEYVRAVEGLLKKDGFLFLKCFSRLQPGEEGPYRFTPDQVREIFEGRLQVLSIQETFYKGTLDFLPRALFCVIQRKD